MPELKHAAKLCVRKRFACGLSVCIETHDCFPEDSSWFRTLKLEICNHPKLITPRKGETYNFDSVHVFDICKGF